MKSLGQVAYEDIWRNNAWIDESPIIRARYERAAFVVLDTYQQGTRPPLTLDDLRRRERTDCVWGGK